VFGALVLDATVDGVLILKADCLLPNNGESPSNLKVFKALVLDAAVDKVPIPKPDCLLPNTGESKDLDASAASTIRFWIAQNLEDERLVTPPML